MGENSGKFERIRENTRKYEKFERIRKNTEECGIIEKKTREYRNVRDLK